MRHVRGLCHSTLMEYGMGDSMAPKNHQKEGEMKVSAWCRRGVQVAYFTLHHTGCTLVLPSMWANWVPRVLSTLMSPRAVRCIPQTPRTLLSNTDKSDGTQDAVIAHAVP